VLSRACLPLCCSLVLALAALSPTPAVGASPDAAPVTTVDVSAGYWHRCAVTTDGRLLCETGSNRQMPSASGKASNRSPWVAGAVA